MFYQRHSAGIACDKTGEKKMNKTTVYSPKIEIRLWETIENHPDGTEYRRLAGSVTQKIQDKIRNSFNVHLSVKAWVTKYERNADIVAESITDMLFQGNTDINNSLNQVETA